MNYLKLTFKEIMQSRILFYDSEQEEACREICNRLKIDNMPAIDGKSNFKLINGAFKSQKIKNVNKVDIYQHLFEEKLLEQFEANDHNVLFVFEGNVMQGVVHICDYNSDIVLRAIQEEILRFERNLRTLLILSAFNNQHILDYLKDKAEANCFFKGKYNFYSERKSEMSQLGEFQLFDFSILLDFCNSKHSIKCFKTAGDSDRLRELRNIAMHGKDVVNQNRQSHIYSIQSLKDFFLRSSWTRALF